MKFGRAGKNSASPTSIFSRVFPVSWLSRFRRPKDSSSMSEMTNSVSTNNKHIGELHNFPVSKMSLPDGTFCSVDQVEDDGAYWRISFSRDGRIQQGRRSTGGINPLWYEAESDPEFEFPVYSFKSLDFGFKDIDVSRERGACPKFNDMVSDIKKTKEGLKFPTHLQDGAMIRSSNDRIGQEDSNSIKLRYRIAREKEEQLAGFDDGKIRAASTLGERDIFPVEFDNKAEKQGHVWKSAHSNARKHPQIPNIHLTSVQEIRVKAAESHGSSRTKNRSRAKAYSPRSEFKIRALEEMKKARMSKGTISKGQEMIKGKTAFDSFAVAKNSYDPQKDFRDSMVQMIREKGIWRSEDLEELLASYLTLNCDEYHDLIIKVFRQVWFEIGGEWHGRQCFDY